jgi:phage-related protein
MDDRTLTFIGAVALFIFGLTMFIQGYFLLHQIHGYSQKDTRKESESIRRRIEELLRDK